MESVSRKMAVDIKLTNRSDQFFCPELHEMVPSDAIGLTPYEPCGHPSQPGKTAACKELVGKLPDAKQIEAEMLRELGAEVEVEG